MHILKNTKLHIFPLNFCYPLPSYLLFQIEQPSFNSYLNNLQTLYLEYSKPVPISPYVKKTIDVSKRKSESPAFMAMPTYTGIICFAIVAKQMLRMLSNLENLLGTYYIPKSQEKWSRITYISLERERKKVAEFLHISD